MTECYVRTLYTYIAKHQDELSFDKGVVLKILQKHNNGWWFALDEKRSMQGFIPANYVEEMIDVKTDLYTDPDKVLLDKATGGSHYGNPDEVLMFKSKQDTDTYKNPDEVLSYWLNEPEKTISDPQYAYPDQVVLRKDLNRIRHSFVADTDKKGTYSYDDNKTKDQAVSGAPLSPKKELVLPHDVYLKLAEYEQVFKILDESDINAYIYAKSPSPECKEIPNFNEVKLTNNESKFSIQKMTCKEAVIALSNKNEGSFLIHKSESSPDDITCSVKRQTNVVHLRIYKTKDGKFSMLRGDCFDSIEDIVNNYYLRQDLFSKEGQNVRLFVKGEDIVAPNANANSFKNRSYYAGKLLREVCESRLMETQNGAFFLREVNEPNTWMLSVRFPARIEHFRIEFKNDVSKYRFDVFEFFETIEGCVERCLNGRIFRLKLSAYDK